MSQVQIKGQPCDARDRSSEPSPRRANLSAIPSCGTRVTSIDLDLTLDCNLRCVYCFKEKRQEHMPQRVAFDAIVWLLHACGEAKDLRVNLMGGEPLMRFDLIQKLVPFAKRRAGYHGKRIHFSATTNNTLVTDELVEFWRRWGIGFHCSIDGIPAVQDQNRPFANGKGSSRLAERGIAKILAYRPGTTARCTVAPRSVSHTVENYRYFRSLGFTDIAIVPSDASDWTGPSIAEFERQFSQVADLLMAEMREGRFIQVKGIHEYCKGESTKRVRTAACGAGRGMALIDVNGGIWPCHRWNKENHTEWCLGSIYEGYVDEARANLDVPNQSSSVNADCETCEARRMCGGGCLAENLEETDNVYQPHPNKCKLTRAWARVGRQVFEQLSAAQDEVFLEHYSSRSNNDEGNADSPETSTR